jgi:serine/threonine protein kinase
MALKNLIGEVLDGKYRIEKQLGEGGMGAVYFATHLGTERPVAVKVIAPQFMEHQEFVERFRREARAAGRLRHPNVVDVTDFGFAMVGKDRVAYLVMEYLDGFTLDEILTEEASVPLPWALDILEQTCSAVDEAHQQGIIHRDLKPENIWLEPNRRGGYTVKVLDFGIAKLDEPELPAHSRVDVLLAANKSGTSTPASEFPTLIGVDESLEKRQLPADAATLIAPPPTLNDYSEAGTRILGAAGTEVSEAGTQLLPVETGEEAGTRMLEPRVTDNSLATSTGSSHSLTRVGSILGTPLYMSPEQCRGESLDHRSDIYSLGVLAYRLVSGKTPFSGLQSAVMKMHCDEPPPPLQVKRLRKKVANLVMSALAKNPADRPQSAAAFASALGAHASGTGALLRRALTMYSEHLPTFVRLAVLVYWPVVLAKFLKVFLLIMVARHLIRGPWDKVALGSVGLLELLVTFFSASVVVGVTTWLVTQILAVPLRPVQLRPAFSAMKKRLRPFLLTTLASNALCLLGFLLCVFPGFWALANWMLVGPVVMMEGLRFRAAMKRSRALYKRARRTVFAIVFIHIGAPVIASSINAVLIIALVKLFKKDAKESSAIVQTLQELVSMPVTITFSSVASVVSALLYWKLRRAGGETMDLALEEFAREEAASGDGLSSRRTRFITPLRTTR